MERKSSDNLLADIGELQAPTRGPMAAYAPEWRPRPVHQRAVSLLFTELAAYVDAEHLGEALLSPADLELGPGTITQPDVFVVPLTPNLPWKEWTDVAMNALRRVIQTGAAIS